MSQGSAQRRMGAQPVFVLSEGSERTQGSDAQSSNIAAGKAVSAAVRTTLGPRGMDKMLVDSSGDVVITNDGATILDEMDIEHPAAQMIVEVAESQEDEVGDGTTTAAVLAGQLLAQAEDLLEEDVHPTTIVEGYYEAAEIAKEAIASQVLEDELDDELLQKVAESSMTGKGTGGVSAGRLAEVVVDAIRRVESGDGNVAREDVHIQTMVGASSSATELVEGVIFKDDPVHDAMPRHVEDAQVAIVDEKLDIKESEIKAEYNVTSVEQLNEAIAAEEAQLKEYADLINEAGANVVFTTENMEDRVASYLANHGILAVENLADRTAAKIRQATGARRIGDVDDLDADALGYAEEVYVREYDEDDYVFIAGGAEAKSVTVFARGGTEHVVDELERALQDALDVVSASITKGGVVPGAGATEIAIADAIRDATAGISGRKQLAVQAFADAVDVLPRTLAHNTGMDPIDALVDLRAHHDREGRAGLIASGEKGRIGDPVEHGIIDPRAVKDEAIDSATEAATMIVRIDDIISAD